ncbi:MAG: hypothetical protein JNK09_19435 [Prolixibacteraceae bacterium]|nr:hypothetical protein [Prolixibacteraceae bacterium]
MKPIKTLLISFIAFISLSGCVMSYQVRPLQVEVMKPGIFVFPKEFGKVAIFKRDVYKSDTCKFRYLDAEGSRIDSTVRNSVLSNECVDAVANFLKKEGFFSEVKNYRDSLNSYLLSDSEKITTSDLVRKTQSDVFVFLDFYRLNKTVISIPMNYLNTTAYLSWTIAVKTDNTSFVYNQVDTLEYNGGQLASFNLEANGYIPVLKDISRYMGEQFGAKIIPSWIPVERMYYRSNNQDMLRAEKYALQNEWIKAAEIWNKETKNKNPKIVAKASYNMALAAEMEGKHDVAIDWLVRSYSALKTSDPEHKANCQRYINVLAMRKKEIERLKKQVRN